MARVRALARCYVNETLYEPGAEFDMAQPKGHAFPEHVEVLEQSRREQAASAASAKDARDEDEDEEDEEPVKRVPRRSRGR